MVPLAHTEDHSHPDRHDLRLPALRNLHGMAAVTEFLVPISKFQEAMKVAHGRIFYDDPTDIHERACRFFEEACELVQALGIREDEAEALVIRQFKRPKGEPFKE